MLEPINGFLNQNYTKILDSDEVVRTKSTQVYQRFIARQRIKWVGEILKHYQGKIVPHSQSYTIDENETIKMMTDWNLKTFLGGKNMTGDMIRCIESEFLEEMVFNIYRTYGKAHLFDPYHYSPLSRNFSADLLTKVGRYFYSSSSDATKGNLLNVIFEMAKEIILKMRTLFNKNPQIDRDDLELIGLRYHHQKTMNLSVQILPNEIGDIIEEDLYVFIIVDETLSRVKPKRISSLDRKSSSNIHVEWYVLSQIVSTVHMISETIQKSLSVDECGQYSLERLCESLNINIVDAQLITAQSTMNPVDADFYALSG